MNNTNSRVTVDSKCWHIFCSSYVTKRRKANPLFTVTLQTIMVLIRNLIWANFAPSNLCALFGYFLVEIRQATFESSPHGIFASDLRCRLCRTRTFIEASTVNPTTDSPVHIACLAGPAEVVSTNAIRRLCLPTLYSAISSQVRHDFFSFSHSFDTLTTLYT